MNKKKFCPNGLQLLDMYIIELYIMFSKTNLVHMNYITYLNGIINIIFMICGIYLSLKKEMKIF